MEKLWIVYSPEDYSFVFFFNSYFNDNSGSAFKVEHSGYENKTSIPGSHSVSCKACALLVTPPSVLLSLCDKYPEESQVQRT